MYDIKTMDAVREWIMQDRHMTYHEIETTMSISSTAIHPILNEHLAMNPP